MGLKALKALQTGEKRRVVLTLSEETAMQLTKVAYAAHLTRSELADILLLKQIKNGGLENGKKAINQKAKR